MKKIKQKLHDGAVSQKDELEEYKNKYLRATADYQNLERRVNDQMETITIRANKQILIELLDVLDDIERAEAFLKDEGLVLVKSKIIAILEKRGIKHIDVLQKEYDPVVAECIEIVDGEKPNIVVKEIQKGYVIHDEILRIAKVAVSKT